MIALKSHKDGSFGAKGYAEGATIGLNAIIGNAVYNKVEVRIMDLPTGVEKVLRGLKEKEQQS